jgi:hypothetical protein
MSTAPLLRLLRTSSYGLFKPLVEGPENMSATDPQREVRYANFVLAVDKLVADNGKAAKIPQRCSHELILRINLAVPSARSLRNMLRRLGLV